MSVTFAPKAFGCQAIGCNGGDRDYVIDSSSISKEDDMIMP